MSDPDASQPGPPIRYPRARLSPAKDDVMVLSVPRNEVEAGDLTRMRLR
ncbi:MAG: hypothetical protein V2I24_14365 [Halieaceae bacterium]|jgi:hypothetical protein|nr:hypothetical protein [Halieaceae bacterium]